MVALRNKLQYLRVAVVIGAVLAITPRGFQHPGCCPRRHPNQSRRNERRRHLSLPLAGAGPFLRWQPVKQGLITLNAVDI